MLQWLSAKTKDIEPKSVPATRRQRVASSEESDWDSPSLSLAAIEVKELSITEFMAVYKAQGHHI